MNNEAVRQLVRFIALLLVQILICNHVHVFGFINPDLYLMALLLLPMTMPKSAQYGIAFATGFIVDIFDMTFGFHAIASLIIIALRPWTIKLFSINKKKTDEAAPSPKNRDFKWLLTYTLFIVLIHQFIICMLETSSFNRFGMTLLSVAINTGITSLLILCTEYIFIPNKSNFN